MPIINRSYRAVERQWLAEYLATRHPSANIQFEKRLHYDNPSAVARGAAGSPTGEEGRPVARLDAWVTLPASIEVWEASQWFHWGKLAQLEHYRDLLPRTYEGKTQIRVPVTWHALTSHPRHEISVASIKANVEYVAFLPDWLRAHQIEVQAIGEARRRQFAENVASGGS